MNTREALTARIRFLRERKDRLQLRLDAITAEIAGLVAQRDALTPAEETTLANLQGTGVVRVED
jgi:hypothetical protein